MKMNLELLFNELEKSTNTGCWVYHSKDNHLVWSRKTYEIHALEFGSELVVSEAIKFYHPEDRQTIENAFGNCISNGEAFKLKLRILDAKGRLKYVESSGKPLYENDQIVSVFGTFKDISLEVKMLHSKRVVQEELKKLEQVLEEHFIVAYTDRKGDIIYANDKLVEISGYSKEELLGKNHRILNSAYHDKDFFINLWKTISSGSPWEGLICNKNKNGELYWVQSLIFPVLNDDGNVEKYVAIRFDVTEKVGLQKELEEERKNLEFSSQLAAIGEISAGIAHEINNPLAVIVGRIDQLKNMKLDENKQTEILNKIEKATDRINKIVKGLHHLAQKSRSDEFEQLDLYSIIDYTFEFCVEALKSKHIEIKLEKKVPSLFILGDQVKVSQILLNLINNARDAILEAKTQEKLIEIVVDKEEGRGVITITDSGPGIPKEVRGRIMDSFFTTKEIGKGTGMGLSLVKKFVQDHKGKIELIDSAKGACFKVSIPLID